MRRFQNLNKITQRNLLNMFPDIEKVIAVEGTDAYRFMAISVFECWLGEEDAMKLLSDVSVEEQKKRDQKFDLFSKKIIEHTDVVNFTMKGRWSKSYPIFRRFLSEQAKYQYMSSSSNYISHSNFFKVALPELGALYFESWDDTNFFYLRDEKSADLIESWANECGLYRLDKW